MQSSAVWFFAAVCSPMSADDRSCDASFFAPWTTFVGGGRLFCVKAMVFRRKNVKKYNFFCFAMCNILI